MVLKLIQVDSEDPIKITLSSGEHLFGRGKLLGCDDKRISRNHGELHVFEDHIEIKALHQNPCFYTKKGTEDKEILRKDSSISLVNGDKFGLLPDAFWYEVIHCTQNESLETVKEDTNTEEYNQETLNPDETVNENVESPSIISETCETVLHADNNETDTEKVTVKRTHSTEQTNGIDSKKVKTEPVEVPNEAETDMEVGAAVQNAPTDVQNNPTEVKSEPAEVKTEPAPDTENDNTESADVKQESKDTAGPSANQAANIGGAANCNGNRPSRERCMYGANCYRRNPAHFAQFSHPGDVDWGAGAQAPCPFGAGCSRRDPRHFRDHTHPPGHRPPPPPGKVRKRGPVSVKNNRKKNRKPSSSSDPEEPQDFEDSGSETSEEQHAVKAGKRRRGSSYSPPPGLLVRLRKKHPRHRVTYSELDSGESDPFATDESDEWKPEPGESQFSEDLL